MKKDKQGIFGLYDYDKVKMYLGDSTIPIQEFKERLRSIGMPEDEIKKLPESGFIKWDGGEVGNKTGLFELSGEPFDFCRTTVTFNDEEIVEIYPVPSDWEPTQGGEVE